MKNIFDAIPNPLFIHGEEFAIVRANKGISEMAGMPFEKMMRKPYYKVFQKMEKPFRDMHQGTGIYGKGRKLRRKFSCPI